MEINGGGKEEGIEVMERKEKVGRWIKLQGKWRKKKNEKEGWKKPKETRLDTEGGFLGTLRKEMEREEERRGMGIQGIPQKTGKELLVLVWTYHREEMGETLPHSRWGKCLMKEAI